MSARIGFVTLDWSTLIDPTTFRPSLGGAGHYRMGMPERALAAHGIETVIGCKVVWDGKAQAICVQDWDNEIHEDLDIVVMQRWMSRNANVAIKLAVANGQTIVNDVDDWYDGLSPANSAFWSSHPRSDPDDNRNHYRKALGASSGLTVSTPFLLEEMRKLNDNVVLVRNAIDLARFRPHDVSGNPTLGWVGSTPWRSGDLEILSGVVKSLLDAHDLRIFHGGHTPFGTSLATRLGLTEQQVAKVPMARIHDYPKFFDYFTIGLAPLNDIKFNHAKSCVKAMEYGASGLPFVASDLPDYRWLSNKYGAGLIARRPRDWRRELERLVADADYRSAQGFVNRHAVSALDINLQWENWTRAYSAISGREVVPPQVLAASHGDARRATATI